MNFNEVSLAVMFLLQEVRIPLNTEQISLGFNEDSGFTYIDIAIALNNLTEKEFVVKNTTPTGEYYSLTFNGRLTLSRLLTDIRASLRKRLSAYARDNFLALSLESKVNTSVSPIGDGKYQVLLRAFDKDSNSSDIFLTVDNSEEASLIAKNLKKHADDAIAALFSVLTKDE